MRIGNFLAIGVFVSVYGILFGLFWFNDIKIYDFMGFFILFVISSLLSFILYHGMIMIFKTNLSFWINSVLKIGAQLISLDDNIDNKEIKKVKKFLDFEFGKGMGNSQFRYFKKQLLLDANSIEIEIKYLRDNSTGAERIRIIQFLVGIAISDRYLSVEEEKFIERINSKLGLSSSTLKMIYSLYNYVSERYKQRNNRKSSSDYRMQKAYDVLELDQSASLDEVKESYRKLAKIFHPDVRNKSEVNKETAKAQFQVISQAYELIKKSKSN